MDRRQYLAAIGGVGSVGLAGCGSGDGDGPGDDGRSGATVDRETTASVAVADATQTPEPEPEPEPEPKIRLGDHELVVEERRSRTRAYVAATVSNTGTAPTGRVTLDVQWYDDAGGLVTTSRSSLVTLGADGIWLARVYASAGQDEIVDYEIDGAFEPDAPAESNSATLLESQLETGDRLGVSGRARNTTDRTISYIEADTVVYDDRGRALSSSFANRTDLPAGETWAFDIRWLTFERTPDVATHTTFLRTVPR